MHKVKRKNRDFGTFSSQNGVPQVNFEVAKGPGVDQSFFFVGEVTFLRQNRNFGDTFVVYVLQYIGRWWR